MRPRFLLALTLASGALVPFAGCIDNTPPVVPMLDDASLPGSDASSPDAGSEGDATTIPDATFDSPVTALDTGAPDAPAVDAGPVEDANPPADASADATTPHDAGPVDAGADASDAGSDAADAGPTGLALQFDGVDDHVELPTADGGANETAFSVELWFKTTNQTGNLFEVYGGGGADRFLVVENGVVCFYVFNTTIELLCSTQTYDDGAWHHAAGTLGVNKGTTLYIDGVQNNNAAQPTSSSFNYDTNFRLGYGHTSLNSALVYFGGELDEVRVWSVERSATDIQANYNRTLDPSTAGLQGYWKLDGSGSDATAKDSTSYGHDGTLESFTFTPSPWVVGGAPLLGGDGG